MRILFVCMPRRGNGVGVYEAAVAHWQPVNSMEKTKKIVRATVSSSLLTHGFNKMWCAALTLRKEHGITHFGMIHDDIGAPVGWADVLMDEMEKFDADLVSAVVPIKDDRGITSTAIDTGDMFSPTRLTMTEVFERDETFTESGLLANTGLWVCRIDRPWSEKVIFRQTDQMVKTDDGRFVARTSPEDWDFSRQLHQHGCKIYCTRKVQLFHERHEFHNKSPWGRWKTDQGDNPQPVQPPPG